MIQVKNNLEYEDYSRATLEHEVQELVEIEVPKVCRLTCKKKPPIWHLEYVTEENIAYCLLIKDGKPSTFHEAIKSPNVSLWMATM